MQASIGQYSMQAGEPAQPVQQSVVIARIRGLFLRAALPSPSDIGRCFSTMSNILFVACPSEFSLRLSLKEDRQECLSYSFLICRL